MSLFAKFSDRNIPKEEEEEEKKEEQKQDEEYVGDQEWLNVTVLDETNEDEVTTDNDATATDDNTWLSDDVDDIDDDTQVRERDDVENDKHHSTE